jgi:hypothetical protein
MNRKQLIVGVGVLVVVAVTAILLLRGRSPNSYRVGCITPLTGDGASYGAATKRGLELARAKINSSGGINGIPIEIVYEDDQMSARVATNAIQKLTNVDGVPVIIGAFGSSVTLAISPIAHWPRLAHRRVQVHAQPRRGVERAPSGRACRACVLRRRPTPGYARRSVSGTGNRARPRTDNEGPWQPARMANRPLSPPEPGGGHGCTNGTTPLPRRCIGWCGKTWRRSLRPSKKGGRPDCRSSCERSLRDSSTAA